MMPLVGTHGAGRVVRLNLQPFWIDLDLDLVGRSRVQILFAERTAVPGVEGERAVFADKQSEAAGIRLVELADDRLTTVGAPEADPDLERQALQLRHGVESLLDQQI